MRHVCVIQSGDGRELAEVSPAGVVTIHVDCSNPEDVKALFAALLPLVVTGPFEEQG